MSSLPRRRYIVFAIAASALALLGAFTVRVDLGRAVNMLNRDLCYDGMHLLAADNRIIVDGFVPPVVEMANKLTQAR